MHGKPANTIPPEILLLAYRSGIFPMADSREDDEVFWVEPRERATIPLDGLHVSRSLLRTLKRGTYRVTIDRAFRDVMLACAAPRADHPESWISERIVESYCALHLAGHAHSIECWLDGEDGSEELVGGLYGVAFDRVFCGESMFARATDASKVALAWLVVLMRRAGAELLDCQFMTDHLASLGAVAMPQSEYLALLGDAMRDAGPGEGPVDLPAAYASVLSDAAVSDGSGADGGGAASPSKVIAQDLTQTS
ncbi:leucyl/phenylalanyl-tRNA--protein transferase [Paraurantiacibacter namhicola]|uniref:Leucyl/phenylalanyl-tRNA--protein transferase n=1 Tax=Paraurantiacibacter namhicola TaxID=645517 RepID=A0A1C7D6L2_9SPHN|nr:leucyl/phenylalanyl-tRNA--protein transferase [Paraurantiacibacter namhicola]ANU07095.1 Leucyl/phenylalanyl-tRNA--protein transferase [Paraurantiacibacter namhicola]